ncbi:class I SAM-dependent methyltransferase [Vineibacter terrae]|uniref:hypothetical protein n=1 Tax=Vineibacter terrae TaxID=2586908 RepID=UPI001C49901D|nr:hypothetical protein [Vineibacter terrae]
MHSDNASSIDQSSAVASRARVAQLVRNLVAGTSSSSLAGRARARRWNLFLRTFPDLERLKVVDLGGTPQFWSASPIRPRSLTVVNLATSNSPATDWVEVVTGDACKAAELGLQNDYDLVFSNSTIEHVGGHDRCLAFAETVKTLGSRHWIQTPYRYFPIEPHFVFPGLQFLPIALRQHVAARWPLSYTKSMGGNLDDPLDAVLWTELLSRTHMKYYFPASEIVSERFAGLTKSLIAVRR